MVHGLGLRDAQTFATRSIVSNDRVKYQPVYEDLDVVVLENQQALPKVFFAPGSMALPIDAPTADDVAAAELDPRRTIVLDQADGPRWARNASDTSSGQAVLLQYGEAGLTARVESSEGGFLVVGDRFELGWRAWVNGQEAPVIRANAIMRAVPVPLGSSRVDLRYDPWWIPASMMISGTIVALVLAVIVWTMGPWRSSRGLHHAEPINALG
jgi:hypothetical protein